MRRALPPAWAFAALFAVSLAFYIYTLQPSLAWGDGTRLQREAVTGESYILAEMVQANFAPDPFPFARVGVAAWDHPLYIMVTHLAIRALPGVHALWLVNLASALFAAGTVWFIGVLVHEHTHSLAAGLLAAGTLAVSHTFWFHAVTPEVYSLVACLLMATAWAWQHPTSVRRSWWLFAAALAFGLAASTHLLALLALPALAINHLLLLWHRRASARSGPANTASGTLAAPADPITAATLGLDRATLRRVTLAGVGFLVGFAPYLIQLFRMLRTFTLSDVMGPAVGATFFTNLADSTLVELPASLATLAVFLVLQFSPIGAGLGIIGLWHGARVSPALWRLACAGLAVFGLFGVLYRVADQFAFFLPAYLFFALLMGLGAAECLSRWPRLRARLIAATALATAALPLVYGLAPGLANAAGFSDDALGIPVVGTGVRNGLAYYVNPNKRGDMTAVHFGMDTLDQLPPNALILAQWYTDTDEYYVLRYYVAVEGRRPDVEIAGWPTVDAFTFDSGLAIRLVQESLPTRPVYLASLSERYYSFSTLAARYCIVAEGALYRVWPQPVDRAVCLGR